MCAHKVEVTNRSIIASVLTNRCPHCRQGRLFVNANPYSMTTLRMPQQCDVCGQPFELEPGFYFGTGYVSYGLSVALSAVTFIVWFFTLGISVMDNSIFWWLGTNSAILVVFQPLLQRLSRSLWIAFFVRYKPGEEYISQKA